LLAQADRIADAIDSSRMVVLKGNVHANLQYDQGPVERSLELGYVTPLLKPSTDQQIALDRLSLGSRTGTPRITTSGSRRSNMRTASESAAVTSARCLLVGIARDDRERCCPRPPLDRVHGDSGTSESRIWRGDRRRTPAPDDLATIYDISPLYSAGIDGSGQKLAIIGRTDITFDDIEAFRKRFNLPANDPQLVLVGPNPGTNPGDLDEADLDIEWSGVVARNASIIYVYARTINTAIQYAVDQNLASVISTSYGICEQDTGATLRAIAQQGNAQGITLVAASGDSGAADCDGSFARPQATQGLAVDFPASLPEVTGVGGAQFNEGSDRYWSGANGANSIPALSYIPETAWNESDAGGLASSGGGASILFPKPAWQSGPGVPNDNARDVPDVSVTAAGHDGYFGISNGSVGVYTGTSLAAPSFAGIVALLNQQVVSAGCKLSRGWAISIRRSIVSRRQRRTHFTTSPRETILCRAGRVEFGSFTGLTCPRAGKRTPVPVHSARPRQFERPTELAQISNHKPASQRRSVTCP
jgi:hypothetical protein